MYIILFVPPTTPINFTLKWGKFNLGKVNKEIEDHMKEGNKARNWTRIV